MRFDVYEIRSGSVPFLVDVQSETLSALESRAVIPMLAGGGSGWIASLHPVVDVNGSEFVLVTHQITSILTRHLKRPVASLISYRDDIIRALDLLFTGF